MAGPLNHLPAKPKPGTDGALHLPIRPQDTGTHLPRPLSGTALSCTGLLRINASLTFA